MGLEFSERRSEDIAPRNDLHNPLIEEKFIGTFNTLLDRYAPKAGLLRTSYKGEGYLDYINTINEQGSASVIPSGRLREPICLPLNGIRPKEGRMILLSYAASLASIGMNIFIEAGKLVRTDTKADPTTYILADRKVNIGIAKLFISSPDPADELITNMLRMEIDPYVPDQRDDLHEWLITHRLCPNFQLPTIRELTETKSQSVSGILAQDGENINLHRYGDLVKNGMQAHWIGKTTFGRSIVYEYFQLIGERELREILEQCESELELPPYNIEGGGINPIYL